MVRLRHVPLDLAYLPSHCSWYDPGNELKTSPNGGSVQLQSDLGEGNRFSTSRARTKSRNLDFMQDPGTQGLYSTRMNNAGARSSQIPAMHALADLLGASGPEEDWNSSNAVLGAAMEARLQDAVFDAVGTRSLAGTLLQRLQQPFEELRLVTYRFGRDPDR
jgi:hypothetical protein